MSNIHLDPEQYSWKKALLWGYFFDHCKKTREGNWNQRLVHAFIATAEFLPLVSQIVSAAEKVIAHNFMAAKNLPSKRVIKKEDGAPPFNYFQYGKELFDLETFKEETLAQLPSEIVEQKKKKTYKRSPLMPLSEAACNPPIPLPEKPAGIDYFSQSATFYAYNAEGVRDYGWGCAWRAIQTSLSSYQEEVPPFERLFHLFGRKEILDPIYKAIYPRETLPSDKTFAPYDLTSGWAEPFIGQLATHFYGIASQLETVNGIPSSCHAPDQAFHNPPLNFTAFKKRLEDHFKEGSGAPVMLDDGLFALNIIGIGSAKGKCILWMADPHIKEGVASGNGLYTITLDEEGRQEGCSVNQDQAKNMFSQGSYSGLHFNKKTWMVLFPGAQLNIKS